MPPEEELDQVVGFSSLYNCITPGGRISGEVSSCIRRILLAFINLRHLCRKRDIRLSIRGGMYTVTVRSILRCGAETWLLRADDVRKRSA